MVCALILLEDSCLGPIQVPVHLPGQGRQQPGAAPGIGQRGASGAGLGGARPRARVVEFATALHLGQNRPDEIVDVPTTVVLMILDPSLHLRGQRARQDQQPLKSYGERKGMHTHTRAGMHAQEGNLQHHGGLGTRAQEGQRVVRTLRMCCVVLCCVHMRPPGRGYRCV